MEVMDYEEKASEGAADTEKSSRLSQSKLIRLILKFSLKW